MFLVVEEVFLEYIADDGFVVVLVLVLDLDGFVVHLCVDLLPDVEERGVRLNELLDLI